MSIKPLNILLADDDMDDCTFFKQALIDFNIPTLLTTLQNGEQLMQLLSSINKLNGLKSLPLPDMLFLDLNMPRKNGSECLSEIQQSNKLKKLPVIVFSTSYEKEVVNNLYQNGAHYFIRKPAEFSQLKKIIRKTVSFIANGNTPERTRENFVISLQKG